MNFIISILNQYINPFWGLILTVLFGTVGMFIKNMVEKYLDTDTKKDVAKSAAAFVEQVWKDIHGRDKLRKALETAQVLLAKKGINFDAEEMEILIEAAVAEFNEAFRKPLKDVNADAIRDNTENVIASMTGTAEEIMAT